MPLDSGAVAVHVPFGVEPDAVRWTLVGGVHVTGRAGTGDEAMGLAAAGPY